MNFWCEAVSNLLFFVLEWERGQQNAVTDTLSFNFRDSRKLVGTRGRLFHH